MAQTQARLSIRPMSLSEAAVQIAAFLPNAYAKDSINVNLVSNIPAFSAVISDVPVDKAVEALEKVASRAQGIEIVECTGFSVSSRSGNLPNLDHNAEQRLLRVMYTAKSEPKVEAFVREVAAHFQRHPLTLPPQDGQPGFIEHYQDMLQQLGAKLASLHMLGADFVSTEQRRFQAVTDELRTEHRAALEQLNQEHQQKLTSLEEKEKALLAREEAIDLRDSKAVRRNLLEDVRKVIDERKEIKLSALTNQKRLPVHVLSSVSLLLFAALAVWGLWKAPTGDSVGMISIIPVSSGILGFGSTLIYYLRWNDQWQKRHAEAEFRNLKFTDDILRASWLAELIFEWEAEKERDFPAELVKSFSRGLFIPQEGGVVEHPAEVLSSLLKEARSIKVGKGLLELDTKAKQ